MQNQAVHSPPFGYRSPPIDGCDALSEDGDTLQTPLTDAEHHQPYAVYHQHKHGFSPLYTSDCPAMQQHGTNSPSSSSSEQPECSKHDDLVKSRDPDRLGSSLSFVDTYLAGFASPARALDLANASLEYDPFAASFASAFEQGPLFALDTQQYSSSEAGYNFLSQQTHYPNAATLSDATVPGSSGDVLSALPSLSVSVDSFDSHLDGIDHGSSLLLCHENAESDVANPRPGLRATASENILMIKARLFSPRFPADHELNPFFAGTYTLGDELGAGGYGFVMTARHRVEGYEVAVKFIIKAKVPEHAWWDDELLGHVPTEVMIMSLVNHDNIARCLDLFEDDLYFYLVQELHGTPWVSRKKTKEKQITAPGKLALSPSLNTPTLTPSPSTDLADSLPGTPPQIDISVQHRDASYAKQNVSEGAAQFPQSLSNVELDGPVTNDAGICLSSGSSTGYLNDTVAISVPAPSETLSSSVDTQNLLKPPSVNPNTRPNFSRRPSYDLFECIEQSKHKRLSENNARYVFAQVVEAVYYLDSQGITHCDVKDENLVIDSNFKVKLIDFGSAVVADPTSPHPYYTLFFGTTAYAASEILRKQPYQAPPAEIWTLGVLLSYLLTGHSPFPTEQDAIDGRLVIRESRGGTSKLSRPALSLMARCLERDPERRADIAEVRGHRWLQGALDRVKEHGLEDRA